MRAIVIFVLIPFFSLSFDTSADSESISNLAEVDISVSLNTDVLDLKFAGATKTKSVIDQIEVILWNVDGDVYDVGSHFLWLYKHRIVYVDTYLRPTSTKKLKEVVRSIHKNFGHSDVAFLKKGKTKNDSGPVKYVTYIVQNMLGCFAATQLLRTPDWFANVPQYSPVKGDLLLTILYCSDENMEFDTADIVPLLDGIFLDEM